MQRNYCIAVSYVSIEYTPANFNSASFY